MEEHRQELQAHELERENWRQHKKRAGYRI